MKKIIIEYLQGTRNLAQGIDLVLKYTKNALLRRNLAHRRGPDTRYQGMVMEELRQLAGLSLFEFLHMKRYAKKPPVIDIVKEDEPTDKELELQGRVEELEDQVTELEDQLDDTKRAKPASETVQRMISFRQRFPFLNNKDCPDVLKILVADMFTAYGRYKDDHRKIREVPGDKIASDLAGSIIENFLEDRQIMKELEHYRDTGALLGQHPKVAAVLEQRALENMSDFDLAKALKNAMANISKANVLMNDPAKAEAAKARLEKWTIRKAAIQAEIEKRSK